MTTSSSEGYIIKMHLDHASIYITRSFYISYSISVTIKDLFNIVSLIPKHGANMCRLYQRLGYNSIHQPLAQ